MTWFWESIFSGIIINSQTLLEKKSRKISNRDKSSRPEVFCRKGVHNILQNSQENTSARVSHFLIMLQAEACNVVKKETLRKVLSCEFRKISKNTFFTERLR